ncbi:MAG TPA: cysteine synthase A, partial [Permianibacter sp.]|nr:cysteine synthase A [Permianibacter sp.]
MAVFNDNSLSIGNTPLVRLARLTDAKVYAKLESRNPAFSVKCRIGAAIIWDAEKKGLLKPGMEIIEATSGNTGIALAFVGAARGYGVTLTMPASMSLERRKLLKVLGAKLVLTDPAKGMRGAVEKAAELVAENPGKYFEAKQFENPANPQIHFDTTGPEIWKDTNGAIDVFVAGVGTGGTLTGVSRYIKLKEGKQITTVAVEPAVSPLITQTRAGEALKPAPHKIQGIGANFVPKNLDLEMVDQVETVSNEEAIETA